MASTSEASFNRGGNDEHSLIAAYCQALNENAKANPTAKIAQEINLEEVLHELNERNGRLRQEYDMLASSAKIDDGVSYTFNGKPDATVEASKLRQHTSRMEARIAILLDHNKQLEARLNRLRRLLHQSEDDDGGGGSKFGTLRTKAVVAAKLETSATSKDGMPYKYGLFFRTYF